MRRLVTLLVAAVAAGLVLGVASTAGAAPTPRLTLTVVSGAPVTFNVVAPETDATATAPLAIRVRAQNAVGLPLTFSYRATTFVPVAPAVTPMPPTVMRYIMSGDATGSGVCSTAETTLNTLTVPTNREVWDYTFNYVMNVPWIYDAGTYNSTLVFTVVAN